MGNALGSVLSQHPVYIATPLLCLAGVSAVSYGAQTWDPQDPSVLTVLLHISSLGVQLGTYSWHNALARYYTKDINDELISKLYLLNTTMSSVCISTFLMRHPFWELEDDEELYQVYLLFLGMFGNLSNTLLFTPWKVSLSNKLKQIENNNDLKDLEARMNNSSWRQTFNCFRPVHYIGVGLGLTSFIANCGYLYYLSQNVKDF